MGEFDVEKSINEFVAAGYSFGEIAEKSGVSRSYLEYWFKRLKLPIKEGLGSTSWLNNLVIEESDSEGELEGEIEGEVEEEGEEEGEEELIGEKETDINKEKENLLEERAKKEREEREKKEREEKEEREKERKEKEENEKADKKRREEERIEQEKRQKLDKIERLRKAIREKRRNEGIAANNNNGSTAISTNGGAINSSTGEKLNEYEKEKADENEKAAENEIVQNNLAISRKRTSAQIEQTKKSLAQLKKQAVESTAKIKQYELEIAEMDRIYRVKQLARQNEAERLVLLNRACLAASQTIADLEDRMEGEVYLPAISSLPAVPHVFPKHAGGGNSFPPVKNRGKIEREPSALEDLSTLY